MKRVFTILMLFALTAVTSCSDDENVSPESLAITVSFENNIYNPNGEVAEFESFDLDCFDGTHSYSDLLTGMQYASTVSVPYQEYYGEGNVDSKLFDGNLITYKLGTTEVAFGSYYSDGKEWGVYAADSFGGFILSQNYTNFSSTGSYAEQFSVFGCAGADETATFLAVYDSAWSTATYAHPTITLSELRNLESIYFASSPMTASYLFDTSFTITVNGYNGDTLVATKDVEMVDSDGLAVISSWTKVNFSWISAVDKITFAVSCTDTWAPYYFCIDEVTFSAK